MLIVKVILLCLTIYSVQAGVGYPKGYLKKIKGLKGAAGKPIGVKGKDGRVNYNYQNNGPDAWAQSPVNTPLCISGAAQSPIDISSSTYNAALTPLTISGLNANLMWDLNTDLGGSGTVGGGHSNLYFYNDYSESSVTLSGGNLPQTYYLAQFHFHWGYNDYEGSEHTINSVKFPLEMHMVFNNISSTTATADNAVVVSILFQLSSADNSVLTPMLNFITPVRSQLNSDTNVTFNAGSILPSTTISTYYQYAGSLTSPPCYQGITWIIPQAYIQISSNQLQTFRNTTYGSAISDDAQPAPANHRDEQLLNGRVVWTSVNPGSSTTSAAPSVFNFSILTFILLNVAFAFNLSA